MGQVITLPKEHKRSKFELTRERHHALVTGLAAIVFLLGFFIAGPALAIYAFGFATTSHLGSAAACVAGLLATWAVTSFAYKRMP
jgi:hypothetical protein